MTDAAVEIFASEANNRPQRRARRAEREKAKAAEAAEGSPAPEQSDSRE